MKLLSTIEAGILVTGRKQGGVEERENKVDGSSGSYQGMYASSWFPHHLQVLFSFDADIIN